ncbi:bifunctional tRNA (5-methylaminomethyl-2-thiouridine)(34)-methyltransferase MnmD/FAD-dependent 5-carboxymethylaminomethyl-2-thiouridine(34) oxidoreductase MnmC [Neptunomonas sp.]|uniref:bifunctional tRNA (5-methylaminomethyl-2-thiouridine)(34)-methyltransferase MnmD/FAD-dependent 5-carboxymethylaminomethyl-2-thiouridine(34) oxidoreductase MnmC n=1 Tax=Neptunomonas sp. TaxID=1971898 RepID=UPI003568AE8A
MQPYNAQLIWTEGVPLSESFGDFYSSRVDAIAESRYVFIDGNQITQRVALHPATRLTIAESGFGTGTNLLCTLTLLNELSSTAHYGLHFISTELYPVTYNDLHSVLSTQPQLGHFANQLLSQYPPAIKGMHRFIFDQGRFYLTLCMGDTTESLARINTPVDAWYLDGFSPAKNPDMWSTPLFQQMARLSKPNTTLATYAAASFVRKGLIEQGFTIKKRPGFGKKRDMLTGQFQAATPTATASHTPWFALPELKRPEIEKPKTAIVIGAGLAGCATAEALARRGIKVQLIDQQDSICTEASGNRQGALYAKLPTLPTLGGEMHLCGLEYTLRLLKIYGCLDNQIASQCGVLQLATSVKEADRQQAISSGGYYSREVVSLVSAEEATKIAGTKIDHQALHFPRAGWVYPKGFCEALIKHEKIKLTLSTSITSLTQTTDKQWCVTDQNKQQHNADIVVVASAWHAKNFDYLNHLPIKPIRGQVSSIKASSMKASSGSATPQLKTVVCGAGYISPSMNGCYSFGATFDLHDQSPELREADHKSNLTMLSNAIPDFARTLPPIDEWQGKVGYRCSTPDYLPIAGPAPVFDEYIQRYAKLRKDKNWKFDNQPAPLHTGLYVNVGHGSKGLITAPLAAEHLASLICGEPSPLPQDISYALHPARFIIKSLIRRKG